MEILILASTPHTGTHFMLNLLGAHKDISPIIDFNVLKEHRTQFYIETNGIDTVLKDIKGEVMKCVESKYRYACLREHPENLWFLPLLLYDYGFKLVAPLRHPYLCLRTHYRRGKGNHPVMGKYLTMIYLLANIPNSFVMPIDIWGRLPYGERKAKMENFFESFLSLPLTSEIVEITKEWPQIGSMSQRELTISEKEEAVKRIENSLVIEKLKGIGINYESTDIDD